MSQLYGNGLFLTERTLDYLWIRQNVTANNIANVDTPAFKSRYVTFEDELAQRLNRASSATNGREAIADAIDRTRLNLHITRTESSRLDGNNVDMDQEQVELVRTAYEYQSMVNSVSNDISRLRAAAKTF